MASGDIRHYPGGLRTATGHAHYPGGAMGTSRPTAITHAHYPRKIRTRKSHAHYPRPRGDAARWGHRALPPFPTTTGLAHYTLPYWPPGLPTARTMANLPDGRIIRGALDFGEYIRMFPPLLWRCGSDDRKNSPATAHRTSVRDTASSFQLPYRVRSGTEPLRENAHDRASRQRISHTIRRSHSDAAPNRESPLQPAAAAHRLADPHKRSQRTSAFHRAKPPAASPNAPTAFVAANSNCFAMSS